MYHQDIIEGSDLSVTSQATPGKANSTTFYWTKVDNPGFRQNGSTLQLHNIQRNSSGTYKCTAENSYNNGGKGTHTQSFVVNVQCKVCLQILYDYDEFCHFNVNISQHTLCNVDVILLLRIDQHSLQFS